MKMGIFVIKGVFIMKNFKKVIALGLATTAVVSAMSMTALANYDDTAYESLPTLSEVDTSKASRENPVTYVDEKTGTIVTICDPSITVSFPEAVPYDREVVVEGVIHVKKASSTTVGPATDSFIAPKDGTTYFRLSGFKYNTYNVTLNREGVTDSPLVILQNKPTNVDVALTGVKEGKSYEFRVSSWEGDAPANYIATM